MFIEREKLVEKTFTEEKIKEVQVIKEVPLYEIQYQEVDKIQVQ